MHIVSFPVDFLQTKTTFFFHVHFYIKKENYVIANLDAPYNAILGNEPSSEMLTSQSQIPE